MTQAMEMASSAPLAVTSVRATLHCGLDDEIAEVTDHELAEQEKHLQTADLEEGVRAMTERRPPVFRSE